MPIPDHDKRVNAKENRKRLNARRSLRLTPGTPVRHITHGVGQILGEWGPVQCFSESTGGSFYSSCEGIYDVMFGPAHYHYLYSCRVEYLERIGQ